MTSLSRRQVTETDLGGADATSTALGLIPVAPSMPTIGADQHPVVVYLAKLSPGPSRTTMREALKVIATDLGGEVETIPWAALRYQHTQAIRTRLAARYAPASANKILAALRGVLREAMRLGQMSSEDYTRAIDLPAVRGSRLPAGRALSSGEIRALFNECDPKTTAGCRDAALLAVLYGGGLRRAEAIGLDVGDYDESTGALRVRGKGNKERTALYATNGSAEALAAWLDVRGREPGPLFFAVNKAGRIERRRLTPHAVLLIVRRVAERAGVKTLSPHSLRRSFVSDLLDANVDITTVAAMAGHSQVTTTARYDRRGERAKKRAAELLHIPFVKP